MAKTKEKPNPLGTVRRSIWYVLRTVLIVSLILGGAFAVFTEGMYISNMYIIVTEGMALRAETILNKGGEADLTQYFTPEFIESDEAIQQNPYTDYAVDNFDYRYSIKGVRVLPWAKTGSVAYIERIPIISASPISDEVTSPVPAWVPMYYRVHLVKQDGRWLISSLEVIEESPAEEVRPTPDYSQLEGQS
jgi:hypothetical protein